MFYLMMAYRLSGNFADKIMGLVHYSHIKTALEVVESSFMSFLTQATTLCTCRLVIGLHEERGAWDKWDRNWTILNASLQSRIISNRDKHFWDYDSKVIVHTGEERRGEEELPIERPVSAESKNRTRWYVHAVAKSKPAIRVSEQSKPYVLGHGSQCVIIS